MPKWIVRSWTFVANAALALYVALPGVAEALAELAALPELSDQSRRLLLAVAVINIALRFRTTQPVTVRPPATPAGEP